MVVRKRTPEQDDSLHKYNEIGKLLRGDNILTDLEDTAIREAKNRENAKAIALAMKLRRLRQAASRAYLNYQRAGTNNAWNRFVRIHIKSGGQPNINRATARRMYN